MISVIGAGPAGSFYSSLAAKNDEVHLFEEDKVIGKPVACTGILTDNINEIIQKLPKELILTKIRRYKIISPNGKFIYIDLKKPDIVLDRAAFDEYIFSKTKDSGVKIHLDEKFLGYKKIGKEYIIKTNKESYTTDVLVGADGPNSIVAKSAGLFQQRKFIQGLQVRTKYSELEEGTTIIHLNMGEFSWIVPEDDKIARVGIVGKNSVKLHEAYKRLIGDAKIIEHQSGIIPVYDPKQRLQKDNENIFLIGDSATQVKATTYGGILYGLHAGKILSENKDTYEKRFNKTLGKELRLSLKMREWMNFMTDKDANTLIEIFQKDSNNKILAEHDRDFPSRFVIKLMLKEPRLWKLGFNILKNKLRQ
jgi:geranylgeranyl reductase family protein